MIEVCSGMAGSISSGAAPDWYMGFLDGPLRITPAWELPIGGYTEIREPAPRLALLCACAAQRHTLNAGRPAQGSQA